MRKKLLVKKELFEKFQSLFTVYGKDAIPMGELEEKPFLIPKRFFGEKGNVVIPMKIKYDSEWSCQAIMVKQENFQKMLSYFHVYEGEFNVPMLRKVFEFPAEHMPGEEKGAFKLVCHLFSEDTANEPKLKQKEPQGGYSIEL